MDLQWTPTFEELARNVHAALLSDSREYVYSVLRELETYKSSLCEVLKAPAPNAGHRAQLKLGSPVIEGNVRSVNEQFIADAVLLSDQLDIDEYMAASVLQHGIQQQAKYDRTPVETAIILFHRERLALLQVVNAILDTSGTFDSPTEFSKSIVPFRNELLQGGLASNALDQIDQLDKKSTTLRNAMTETSALVAQLGMPINEKRLQDMKQERTLLGTILFNIAFYHELSSAALKSTITALKKYNLSDPIATYLTVAVMAALEVSPEHMRIRGKGETDYPEYMTQDSFMQEYARFITDNNWAVPAIRATVMFQFSLCLGHVCIGRRDELTEDELQLVTEKAIASDTLQFIANYILGFKSQVIPDGKQIEAPLNISNASLGIIDQNTDGFDTTVGKPVAVQIETPLQDGILALLEFSIRDFIITMLPLLRAIKHKEEDLAAHQSHQSSQKATAPALRNDLEALFTVIALIYKDRPEAGIRFWPNNDDRLYRFLKWAVDCKNTARSFFDMLSSLATGSQCANHAYEFLKSNGGRYGAQSSSTPSLCSWGRLFDAVEFYTSRLNADIAAGGQVEQILPEEEALLKSFLRLLSVVAQFSAVARTAMNDSKQFQVIHLLFRFFICPISVGLKASILDAIAAFATPSALGNDTASLVWEYLEQARILPKTYIASLPEQAVSTGEKSAVSGTSPRQDGERVDSGIGYDIEEIEAANETFPETIAFARLLSTLIQVPLNPDELLSGGSPSIPTKLGSNYRQPGVIPYVRFVLDMIFVKALNRTYRVANEKWKVVDVCLTFMERCLLSFDIGSFIIGESLKKDQDQTSIEAQRNNAIRASLHPAFEILTRLLSGGDVLREIFRIMGTGVDILNKDDATTPHLQSAIARCFRILTKTMQLQDVFMEYIVQVLLTTTSNKSYVLSSLAPIEQHLSYSNSTVIDIACYINSDVSLEICSLSIEILDRLSASAIFTSGVSQGGVVVNRLVRLLESSPRSKQILYGFVQKLEAEDEEHTNEFGAPYTDSSMAIDGADSNNAIQKRAILTPPPVTTSTIRLQIMRLLLDNLDESRSPPTIAHFLLGYPTTSRIIGSSSSDMDVLASQTSFTTLHVTLELLRRGKDGQGVDYSDPSTIPLYITHPQLAEKCQELLYRLCSEPETTASTMRFLRTRESFFYRHLRELPIRFEAGLEGSHGVLTRVDGSQMKANFFNLLSQLYQRSWVMRTSALELRVACETQQRREALNLLSLLYSNTDSTRAPDGDDFMYSISRSNNGNLAQPRMKVLELLDALDFSWDDDLKIKNFERYYFADVSEDSCLEKDERDIDVYNVRKLFSLLLARKSQLENENMISGSAHRAAALGEMGAIMEQCLARNHARRLESGRRIAIESWREMIEITLGPGYDLLKVENREVMLYDVLEAVLAKLQGDCPADIATILSKVALAVLQRLRTDHFRQFISQATSTDPSQIDARLPAERLHRVARNVIACILRPGTSMYRCNLYSTLVNYFQYTRFEDNSHRSAKTAPLYVVDGQHFGGSNGHGDDYARGALELGNQVLVSEAGERLLEIVSRDASDVDQVCKIAAFTLLNTMYGLFEKEVTNRVLVHLVQRNYLKHFIDVMAREDLELQASVKGRVSRMPIVSESRMTLFLRIAQRRDGAEQLLEYGFFDVLTNSSTVIDMRSNLDSTDFGPFEQTESSRYHNIVYPMFQVAVAILANLGRNHRTAANKAELFVSSHHDTFESILRDNMDSMTTTSSLRELRSVTAFLNQLAGHIAAKASSSAAVFGPLHSLLLALIPKYLTEQWAQTLKPVSDSDLYLSTVQAPSLTARAGTSVFDRDARSLARDISKNLLSYCQITTDTIDRAAKAFTPLFTWTISSVSNGQTSAPAPSLATLISFMGMTAAEVQEAMLRHQTQLHKLNNVSSLTPEEKQDILDASDEDFVGDLVAIQRDQLAVQVLQKMLLSSTQDVLSSLFLLETSLVLLWRHLEYYFGQYPGLLDGSSPQAGLGASRFGHSNSFNNSNNGLGGFRATGTSAFGLSAANGFGASSPSPLMASGAAGSNFGQSQQLSKSFKPTLSEAQTLKRDAGHVVKPVLDSIMTLDLSQERIGWDNSSRNSFIELLVLRVRALIERN